ncbi:MAG TPA: S8 family serine peptidase [Pseudonocardiaceae bacterium]|nr:S8 family serine peptidase [Pseudonocardiaceae bacterium]
MLLRLLRIAAVVGAVFALPGSLSSLVAQGAPGLPECTSAGPLLRYVALFDVETPEPRAARTIRAACGTSVAYYPQIGVAVVTSAEPGFAARFGVDRAYSAQAEVLVAPQRAELTSPKENDAAVLRTADRLPATAPALSVDHSAEQWNMALIHAPQARTINRGNPEVLVGVLDSGVDATHPDLATTVDPARSAGCLSGKPDQEPPAWSPSTSVHGTHVAGTIAAADDGRGITGIAPRVRLASVKVVDDDGFIYPEYAVCGFMWAARQQMRIANSSFFLDPWLLTCSDVPGQAVAYEAVRRTVAYATAQGVLSVAAAGNERMDLADPRQDVRSPDNAPDPQSRPVNDHCDVLPAELPGVIAVSAVGAQQVKSGYSSYGLGVVAVTAPGGDVAQHPGVSPSGCVLSTIPGGYGYACGTSMAAPHVSGVAALLASSWPEAHPAELATLLRQQADPLPCPVPDNSHAACTGDAGFYGHGLVNALTAVTAQPGSGHGTDR